MLRREEEDHAATEARQGALRAMELNQQYPEHLGLEQEAERKQLFDDALKNSKTND